jgi:SNF2 family DNA or RNA helicase
MVNPVFIVHCERISNRQAYYLRFSINNQLIERIKSLPEETRKWNASMMAWEITTLSLMLLIKKYKGSNKIHFDFGNDDSRNIFIKQIKKLEIAEEEKRKFIDDLKIKKEHWLKYKLELEATYIKYIEVVHKHLKTNTILYPHQVISTMFLNVTRNLLLALDMGTGKSLISIAYVEMNAFNKVFVITPNSLKYNYYNEVEKFTNSLAYIVGKKNTCKIEDAKYIIVNYEYFNSSDFKKVESKFNKLNIGKIDCLISDECHRLKSTKSNTYKNFKKIFKDDIFNNKKISKIFMSGTPAPSKAAELYTILHQISSIDFPTKKHFYEYYCGMIYDKENGWGYVTDTMQQRFDELFHKIEPYIYRKKKSEVLKDLPEKTYQKIILEMTSKEYEIYFDLEEGVANEFLNKEIKNPLSIMGKLREYTSHLKANNIVELIDSILECGEKFVVIDFYKNSLYELHKQYPEISALHTGDEKDEVRAEIVKDFQNDDGKIKIFLGSEGTTKEGLTLTAASKVGMLTIPWTPGALDQCTDRLARIGQKNAVNAYILVYKDSID